MRRVSLFVYLILGGVAISASRQSPAKQQPTFRAGTEIIQLDVSVLDKDRKPIRDLTQADFTVLEDGRPRPVVAFSAVDVADPPALTDAQPGARLPREVAPDVATNALPPEGRLFVVILDDALLPPSDPNALLTAKRVAHAAIDHLAANDRMAVVFTKAGQSSQDFTNDKAKLTQAVERLEAGTASYTFGWDSAVPAEPGKGHLTVPPSPPGFDGDFIFRQGALNTLEDVADVLLAAPHRRRVIVYISPGIPVGPSTPSAAHGTGRGTQIQEANNRLADQLGDLYRRMQRANITIYPVDPTGLDGLEQYARRELSSLPVFASLGSNPLPPGAGVGSAAAQTPSEIAHRQATFALDFLDAAAVNTGGRALVNTNDVVSGIDGIFRENGSYYLLGVEESDPGSGKMHRLNVNVDRPNVEVRTRHGYYASDALGEKKLTTVSPVARAMSKALPDPGLSMQLAAAPFASSDRFGATVALAVLINQLAPSVTTPGTVDLETRAFTPDGYAQGTTQRTTAALTLPGAGVETPVSYEILSHMELKPGRYQFRLAAHSSIGDGAGSVFADVEIPDFVHAPVSLSGVMLTSAPAPPAAPKDALTAIVPVIPTVSRAFGGTEHVSAFVRVYQGGLSAIEPLAVHITILNEKGETVLNRDDALGVASFDSKTRAADERVALPLDKLAPGDYLLTIETSRDKTNVRRDVRFTLR